MLKDKLTINELDTEIFNDGFNKEIAESIEIKKNSYQKLSHEKEITIQQLNKSNSDFLNLDKVISNEQNEITQIENKIKKLDESNLQNIKNQKKSLQEEIKDKESSIPKEKIKNFLSLNILETEINEINIQSAYLLIQELKSF